jgi:potassium channel subfamily K
MQNYQPIGVTESTPLARAHSNETVESPLPLFWKLVPRWDVIVLLIYFVVGVSFYSSEEGMPFILSLYFCMITFTTVGFGDFAPSTFACKLFTCSFVFVGLAIIATLVSNLLDYIIEERSKAQKQKWCNKFDEQDSVIQFHSNDSSTSECLGAPVPGFARPIVRGLKQSVIIISLNILIGTIFYSHIVDNYSLIDAFYLSCMIITTVGYGDIKPTNDYARAFTILYSLLGTLMTGNALSKFANAISDYKQAQVEASVLAKPLNVGTLLAMDVDKTNIGVSKEEFVLYKLKAMGALDPDLVLRAESQFHRLDITKTGYLSVKDIVSFEEKVKRVDSERLIYNTSEI